MFKMCNGIFEDCPELQSQGSIRSLDETAGLCSAKPAELRRLLVCRIRSLADSSCERSCHGLMDWDTH